jgi:hypothetical protein
VHPSWNSSCACPSSCWRTSSNSSSSSSSSDSRQAACLVWTSCSAAGGQRSHSSQLHPQQLQRRC